MDELKTISELEKNLNHIGKTINQLGDAINQLGESQSLLVLPIFGEEKVGDREANSGKEKASESYISLIDEAEAKLREAKNHTRCGKCHKDIDDILYSLKSKKQGLIDENLIIDIMEEKGMKSWIDLDETTKKEIKKEVERRKNAKRRT